MSKLFFEMTETEAQLQNIFNSLEYAQYQMSTGINGYGNGTMTREEHQETEQSVLRSLGVAMSGVQKLIGEYASLEEAELLPEMATEEIMQINAESVDQYEAIQKAFRLGMEKAKSENVVEHPVYGSEDMEELRQCVLIDLEDCMTKDRETGEKGEALCMTFQNEEGKYIIIKHTITNLFSSLRRNKRGLGIKESDVFSIKLFYPETSCVIIWFCNHEIKKAETSPTKV